MEPLTNRNGEFPPTIAQDYSPLTHRKKIDLIKKQALRTTLF